jgi:raffinose/stachyose/melibiose transport system permease protein
MIRSKKGGIFWIVILFVIAFLWMIPFIFMVSMSFRTPDTVYEPYLFVWPITFQNFVTVIKQNPLFINFLNSFIVTLGSVILVTLGASMAAFGLTRKGIRGKKLIYSLLLVTLMVPISALVIPLTQIDSNLHWLNSYQGLILPYTALGIPFALVIIKGFMDKFPHELEEAAIIDGCSTNRLFFSIVMPMLRPGLIVVIIWQFLTSWNEFFLALVIMSDNSMKTLTLVPMEYSGSYFSQPGDLFAILVLTSIPMIVIYILVQRKFVHGLISGAIKG